MNKVILVGRMAKDPELRATTSGVAVASFAIACDRRFVKQGEERKVDFINCIAWRQTGESISKYFKKGDRIALEGTLQVRDWTDDNGKKHYATEVVVDQWEFAQSKNGGAAVSQQASESAEDIEGFMPIEEDLPF